MKIAVFGLGYVGMTTAACLAREGHEILGVDVSDEKVAAVNSGKSPITEPGLAALVQAAVGKQLLRATTEASLDDCAMAIVCVGTPATPDGSLNMGFISEVSRQIAALAGADRKEPLTVVYRSTMRPGTIEELIRPIFAQRKSDVEIVYNPEFLREGVAVADFFDPPKIVVGTNDGKPCAKLATLNAGLKAQTFTTTYREAELTKFVDNAFHATKVAFANEIGRVCHQLGIDARTVHRIFTADTKLNISPIYLRPGGAFGGSCLPKDVRALQHMARDMGADTYLVDSLLRSNEAHKDFLFELCASQLSAGASVLLLGLAFKADSDDLRGSPNIDLARRFLDAGFSLSIYDPHVEPANLLGQNLGYAVSNLPALQKLLIGKAAMEAEHYDLVVDTRGWAKTLALRAERIIDVNTLA